MHLSTCHRQVKGFKHATYCLIFFLCIYFLPDSPHFEVQALDFDLAFAIMSNYAESWTSTPWQQPDALHAVQHLQTLLCTAENDTRDPTVPQRVCSVVGDILSNIEEKIKSHCKHKHLTGRQVTCDTRNSVTCSSHKCDAKIPSLVAVQPLTLQAHL